MRNVFVVTLCVCVCVCVCRAITFEAVGIETSLVDIKDGFGAKVDWWMTHCRCAASMLLTHGSVFQYK